MSRECPLCGYMTQLHICPYCNVKTIPKHNSESFNIIKDIEYEDAELLFGKYRKLDILGKGGMGYVYKGYDVVKKRDVAIKIIDRKFINSPKIMKRLEREVFTCASLEHNNIVKIYEFRKDKEDEPVIIMEFLDGNNLHDELLEVRKRPYPYTFKILKDIASALDYAHRKRIVHRDIKPSNIILVKNGVDVRPVLTDFGLAKWMEENKGSNPTTGKVLLGTPSYMSPEQIKTPSEVDGRADIYSLGVLTFEMLAGYNPFKKNNTFETIKAQLQGPIPKLPRAIAKDLPKEFVTLLYRMLSKDRAFRVDKASEIVRTIQRLGLA